MRLILIRHGQTTCNLTGIWHGWDQCELTALGVRQAEAAAQRLASEPLAAVYSSDLRRAIQTGEIVGGPHGLAPRIDSSLRERNAGAFQESTMEEILATHPAVWEERIADYWGWMPPEGESFRQVLERCLSAVARLEQRHRGQTVALIGHMGTIRVLSCTYLGISMEESYELDFVSTGISIFHIENGVGTVELFNDGSHLQAADVSLT